MLNAQALRSEVLVDTVDDGLDLRIASLLFLDEEILFSDQVHQAVVAQLVNLLGLLDQLHEVVQVVIGVHQVEFVEWKDELDQG